MGWLYSSEWKTKEDLLYDWKSGVEAAGYTVSMSGNWAYAEDKDGKPVDLVYVMTKKDEGEWGYKDLSVTCCPYHYSAPLWMVIKVHPIFIESEYYRAWFEKYPKKNKVLESYRKTYTATLFEEAV